MLQHALINFMQIVLPVVKAVTVRFFGQSDYSCEMIGIVKMVISRSKSPPVDQFPWPGDSRELAVTITMILSYPCSLRDSRIPTRIQRAQTRFFFMLYCFHGGQKGIGSIAIFMTLINLDSTQC
jgi:hypothetical protein